MTSGMMGVLCSSPGRIAPAAGLGPKPGPDTWQKTNSSSVNLLYRPQVPSSTTLGPPTRAYSHSQGPLFVRGQNSRHPHDSNLQTRKIYRQLNLAPRSSAKSDKKAASPAAEVSTSAPSLAPGQGTNLKAADESQGMASDTAGRDPDLAAVESGKLSRAEALRLVDECLEQGDERKALALVRLLQGRPGGLRAFGAARQVPQRIYTLDELRLNKIHPEKFLSPSDSTLGGVKRTAQITLLVGVLAAWQGLHLDQMQLLGLAVGILFLGTADQIANGGGGEALMLDTLGNLLSQQYRNRVAQHEAGHFLVSYLVGILPKAYTLSSLDAYRRYGALNVQAGTTFVDYEFQEEAQSGKLRAMTLDRFSCVALAGVATEYLEFGLAEGGLSDIQQLDNFFKSLGFTQKKADSQVRWAVLNTVALLRRHARVHKRLVEAMKASKPVGACIEVIESTLGDVAEV